jgi:gamma-butyrobetaine dioxygenase
MTRLTIDAIFDLYLTKGQDAYRGETVSQLEHALQAAHAAERAGAPATLVIASLLHDYGHYVHDMDGQDILNGVHDHHDARGADALAAIFPPAVTEPVRLHIEAKRYLCAVDADYLDALSFGSRFSLQVQGGPYSGAEAADFEARPFALEAARVRRWDDAAKVPGQTTPDLEHYRPIALSCLAG